MGPVAEIDLTALAQNLNFIRSLSGAKILAIVKGNAYGHGLIPIAQFLTQNLHVDALGVGRVEEAISLRKNNITSRIVVLDGFLDLEELASIYHNKLEVVIHSHWQIDLILKAHALKKPIPLWLQVDVGMHQLGFTHNELEAVCLRLKQCPKIEGSLKFLAHLPRAADHKNSITQKQTLEFCESTKTYDGSEKSLARSAAFLAFPETHLDWIRIGSILYGFNPFKKHQEFDTLTKGIVPVMTLSSTVIALKDLKAGDEIGYGGTWVCPHNLRVAIVAMGYGDGYPRNIKEGASVLIKNKKFYIVGRVSMDKITVLLESGNDDVAIGDTVIFWGKGLSIEAISDHLNNGPAELFCRLTNRVKFNYIYPIEKVKPER